MSSQLFSCLKVFGCATNWIITDKHSEVWHFEYDVLGSNFVLYLRSIYWALYTTSSIGYYDILGTNSVETIGITLLMLFGCQLFLSCVGDIASVMGNLDVDSKRYKTKVNEMMQLMTWKQFPSNIREKVLNYFDYDWKTTENIREDKVTFTVSL